MAQGCEALRATLGKLKSVIFWPLRQGSSGQDSLADKNPGCARKASRPWAILCNPFGQRRERFLPKNIGFGFHPEGMAESSRGIERSEDPRKTVLLSSHPGGMPESVNSGAFSIWTEIGQSAIPPGWRTG